MDDAGVVGDDVKEVLRLLERADDRVVRAFENADDTSFGAIAAFGPGKALVAGDAGYHLVAMHGRAGVLGGDEQVLLARCFPWKKRVTRLMHRERSRHQIGFRRKDITVLPDSRDFAGLLHFRSEEHTS